MGRYTKNTSTYIKRSRSQGINGGNIFERDWTTLGERQRFGAGKTPIYTDGNFVFTTSKIQTPNRKTKPGEIIDTLTYEDVKDSKPNVNNVIVYPQSDDISSYAYYGSCVDLFQGAISNIVANFPGCLYTKGLSLMKYNETKQTMDFFPSENPMSYIVLNPFLIDFFTKEPVLNYHDNELRYFAVSYDKYEIEGKPVLGFNSEIQIDPCPPNNYWENTGQRIGYITIRTEDRDYNIDVYGQENGFVYVTEHENFELRPQQSVIESYFDNLNGIERILLTRKSSPLYTNSIKVPLEPSNEGYVYKNQKISWPTIKNGHYCIDVSEGVLNTFIENVHEIAEVYDVYKTDNLYGRMTHEAIKNYDWTYTQEYYDGDEEIFIGGGDRMKDIIHFIGRTFDDLKVYVDGIKNSGNVSYNGNNNMPDAMLSEKAELSGWDVTSVIPTVVMEDKENAGYVKLSQNFLETQTLKWYDGCSCEGVDTTSMDNDFMRRLILSSKRIFESKGTQESIEMVMGLFGLGRDKDYELYEQYYLFEVRQDINKDENGNEYSLVQELSDTVDNTSTGFVSDGDDIYPNFNTVPVNTITEEVVTKIKVETNNQGKKVINPVEESYQTKTFIIPYYRQDDFNRDYYYFQSRGGWGNYDSIHIKDEEGNITDCFRKSYETVSYLNIVSNISELFNISSITSNKGDIYFVIDISDYETIFGNQGNGNNNNISHFFYLKNEYIPSEPSAWENILNEWSTICDGSYKQYYWEKAQYLNGIILNTLGNNPHVGFGYYDNGAQFIEYMRDPFKVQKDNYLWLNEEPEGLDKFIMDQPQKVIGDKLDIGSIHIDENDLDINETDNEQNIDKYYYKMNSKVFILRNNHTYSDLFKQYLKETIMPYVMQVIPSTTILILEGF